MKNKKPIIALGAVAVVGLIAGTIAYFTSEAQFDNVFTTATYKTESQETFTPPSNWVPGQEVSKTVVTENKGTIPVAVRVSTSESWKDKDNNPISQQTIDDVIANIPASAHDTTHIAIINLADNYSTYWTSNGGYHYYKTALGAKSSDATNGPTTESFIKSVTLNPDLKATPNCTRNTAGNVTTVTCATSIDGLGQATYTLTITVETVQYDKYREVWFPNYVDGNTSTYVPIAPAA